MIKFVSELWQVGSFSPGTRISSTNKTDRHGITEILLKVALNTIALTPRFLLAIYITYIYDNFVFVCYVKSRKIILFYYVIFFQAPNNVIEFVDTGTGNAQEYFFVIPSTGQVFLQKAVDSITQSLFSVSL